MNSNLCLVGKLFDKFNIFGDVQNTYKFWKLCRLIWSNSYWDYKNDIVFREIRLMRNILGIKLNAKEIRDWCKSNLPNALAILSFILTLLSIFLVYPHPQQRLSYRVLPHFREVFKADKDPRLFLMVRDSQLNWHICGDAVDTLEMEIINSGSENLWYNSPDVRPKSANPICIELKPQTKILDARVIVGDVNLNGFQLIEDDRWRQGCVECKWRRLLSGESVTISIIYVRPKEPIKMFLSGELKHCAKFEQLTFPKVPTLRQQIFRKKVFLPVVIITLMLWGLSLFRTIRKQKEDKQLSKTSTIPSGVIPSVLKSWRQDIYFKIWLWLCLLVIIMICFTVL